MAYYNANGQITIDEAAANADIQKIRQAIAKLEEAQSSIKRLSATASSMSGYTGSAIVEQSAKLETQIKALNDRLHTSANYIRRTVQKYKEQDAQLAQQIKSGGGV